MSMTATERIYRCKAQLSKKEPFYGYLVFVFRFIEKLSDATLSITHKGNVFFNPKFVEEKTEKDLIWILKHECLHIVLEHHPRMIHLQKMPGYNHSIANIAADCCVNWLLYQETQYYPEDSMVGINGLHAELRIAKSKSGKPDVVYTVQNVGTKKLEDIYSELLANLPKILGNGKSNGKGTDKGDGKGDGKGTDKGDGKEEGVWSAPMSCDVDLTIEEEQGKSSDNITAAEAQKWKSVVATAVCAAQLRGLLPGSLKGIIEEMYCPKLPWQSVLRKFFSNQVVRDTTWARPSRRAAAAGLYLPASKKTGIDLVLHVDTSGSVWSELDLFLSQLYWILNGIDAVNMTLILCDATISSVKKLTKADLEKDTWKMHEGGGGTSHVPVVDWIKKNDPHCKIFLSFTDGESDIESCYKDLPRGCHTMIILPAKHGDKADRLKPHASTVLVMNN